MNININQQDLNGNAPLHLAAFHGDMKACSYLLQYGAKVLIRNRDGNSPCQLAYQQKHIQCFNYLKRAETVLHTGKSSSFTTVSAVSRDRDHSSFKQREAHVGNVELDANPWHLVGEGGGEGEVIGAGEGALHVRQLINYATNPPEQEAKKPSHGTAPVMASFAWDDPNFQETSKFPAMADRARGISPEVDPQFEIFRAYHVHAD
eukprot:753965-Hanusia_phi.AAC.5